MKLLQSYYVKHQSLPLLRHAYCVWPNLFFYTLTKVNSSCALLCSNDPIET